jgi:hypothetical protein
MGSNQSILQIPYRVNERQAWLTCRTQSRVMRWRLLYHLQWAYSQLK